MYTPSASWQRDTVAIMGNSMRGKRQARHDPPRNPRHHPHCGVAAGRGRNGRTRHPLRMRRCITSAACGPAGLLTHRDVASPWSGLGR